jgi:hypothetical protein
MSKERNILLVRNLLVSRAAGSGELAVMYIGRFISGIGVGVSFFHNFCPQHAKLMLTQTGCIYAHPAVHLGKRTSRYSRRFDRTLPAFHRFRDYVLLLG